MSCAWAEDAVPRAVVLVSGGLDSATVLAIAREAGYDCYALSFDYGQRTIRIFHGIESAEADATIEVLKSSLGVRRNA